MSVAVCRGPTIVPAFEAPTWLRPVEPYKQPPEVVADDHRPAQVDIWNAIQADVINKAADVNKKEATGKPYVHPLVRRSSSRLMSQKSLEVCTESLGNETGSGDFTSSLDMASLFDSSLPPAAAVEDSFSFFWHRHDADRDREEEEEQWETKDLAAVNYHCSSGTTRSRSPRRAFPPPLPSMSRRDGPCLQMRSHRRDGRLVVEAVAVRPCGYLNARRQGGRLRLSFVECCARDQTQTQSSNKITAGASEAPFFPAVEPSRNSVQEEEEVSDVEMEEGDEEVDEEEVEVVDRGTVVEVKVSTQPQAPAAAKVHRSTLVINKFVGSTPVSVVDQQPRCHVDTMAEREASEAAAACDERPTLRRVPSSTTTLAAAVAVASTETDVPAAPEEEEEDECGGAHPSASAAAAEREPKQPLLFTSRRGDKQDLLQSVRRCRQLRQKPLFILEPYCIATS
ncbi:hypothetical protein HU200_045386 [Digitaria exilis]|uniref:FAF domain-containing protein n=1 Tax=Digitaria exilis TaxID=1010633 RepID=A0A835B385_9POAL|nr:hypothetical protein HU200_045386 [Digitaria exilis]